jgi:hypothetical protein
VKGNPLCGLAHTWSGRSVLDFKVISQSPIRVEECSRASLRGQRIHSKGLINPPKLQEKAGSEWKEEEPGQLLEEQPVSSRFHALVNCYF